MCFRCSCQIMNFTRMLGSLVIKKHVVCRRSLAQLFLCSGVGCVATWVRCQARGRTRCAGAREPALGCSARARPAACRASPSLRCRQPGACRGRTRGRDRARKTLLKAGRFRWRREVAGLLGPWRSVPASGFPAASGGSAPWPGASATCPAQRRWHLLRHRTTDAFPGPQVSPVPFAPGRPRQVRCAGRARVCAAGDGHAARPAPHLGSRPGTRCPRFRRTVISRIEIGFC